MMLEKYFLSLIIIIIKIIHLIILKYIDIELLKIINCMEITLCIVSIFYGFYIYNLFLYIIIFYNIVILFIYLYNFKSYDIFYISNIILNILTIILYIIYNLTYIIDIKSLANYNVKNYYLIYTYIPLYQYKIKYITVNIDDIEYVCNSTDANYIKNIPLKSNTYIIKNLNKIDEIKIDNDMIIYIQQYYVKCKKGKHGPYYYKYEDKFDVYIIDNKTKTCYYIYLTNSSLVSNSNYIDTTHQKFHINNIQNVREIYIIIFIGIYITCFMQIYWIFFKDININIYSEIPQSKHKKKKQQLEILTLKDIIQSCQTIIYCIWIFLLIMYN